MKGTTRRTLAIGALIFVLLLGVGLWPRHVFMARTDDAAVIGPDGVETVTWTASADCSILMGEFRVETYRKPLSTFLRADSLCGDPSPARIGLIIALVLTATGVLVALLWTSVTIPEPDLDSDLESDELATDES